MQKRVVAIEQTTSGISQYASQTPNVPVIDVASSSVKSCLEPPLIAKAVVDKTVQILDRSLSGNSCGVLGLGRLGGALVAELKSREARVCGFDSGEPMRSEWGEQFMCTTPEQLLEGSEVVFGCTGTDCLEQIVRTPGPRIASGGQVFASCSSSDVEFRSLCEGAVYKSQGAQTSEVDCGFPTIVPRSFPAARILRSGFPVNFDNSPHSVPADRIQVTRGLLFAGVLQAAQMIRGGDLEAKKWMLAPSLQRMCVNLWGAVAAMPSGRVSRDYCDLEWIAKNSGSGWRIEFDHPSA